MFTVTAIKMKISVLQIATVLIFALLSGSAFTEQNNTDTNSKRAPKFTKEGTKGCQVCHSGERMQIIEKTVHGKTDKADSPYGQQGCESCHGPGSFHVSRAHGGRGFRNIIKFGTEENDEIILSTDKGSVMRCAVKEIRVAGRNTQGVTIKKLSGSEKVVSAIKIEDNIT